MPAYATSNDADMLIIHVGHTLKQARYLLTDSLFLSVETGNYIVMLAMTA